MSAVTEAGGVGGAGGGEGGGGGVTAIPITTESEALFVPLVQLRVRVVEAEVEGYQR